MVKRLTKREIRRTLEFVTTELERYHELFKEPEKRKQALKEDGWVYGLPFPNERKHVMGKAAYKRLSGLTRTIIATYDRLQGRVRFSSLYDVLSKELGRVLKEQDAVDEHDFIETCVRQVTERHIRPFEFFIPCIAPNYKGLKRFRVGPVTFVDKHHFVKNHRSEVQVGKPFDFDDFEKRYDVQNWIACVRIDGFDKESSRERAFLCVRLAVAFIKTRLGRDLAQWLGSEKQSMPGLTHYSLYSEPDETNVRAIKFGWGRQSFLNGGGKEVEHLMSVQSRTWFEVSGAFLDRIVSLGQWDYLDRKIVTALIWLDIGNSPISDAERVVAFANCLEALFVTKERDLKRQISARAHIFLEYSLGRSDLRDKVEHFYSKRSKIVHGDIMPLDEGLSYDARLGKDVTNICMQGFLHFSRWLRDKHEYLDTKEHNRPFNGKPSFDRALEEELPLFMAQLKESRSSTAPRRE